MSRNKKKGAISASMMCTGLDKLFYYLAEFKEANLEYLHLDIMDGSFVPNFALGTDFTKSLRRISDIPFDYHFLVNFPEMKMQWFDIREGDQVAFHYEGTQKIMQCIDYIKSKDARAFITINPETSFEVLDPYLEFIDGVLVMTVVPGFAGRPIVPTSFDKVEKLRHHLDKLGYKDMDIEVDGNITIENAEKLYKAGANIFVAGSSSLFKNCEVPITSVIEAKRKVIGWK